MGFTNYDLIQSVNTLNKYVEYKLPQRISYAITKNLLRLREDEQCYSKMLEKIVTDYKDYFIKDKDGATEMASIGVPKVTDDVSDRYYKEIEDLLSMEIDVSLYKIDLDTFDYEEDKYDLLTANDMMELSRVLCE